MKVIYLDITTWVGTSIGAQHTYGKLKWRSEAETLGFTEEELNRPLTAKEARAQNAEAIAEGATWRQFKAGEPTRGFANEEEVILAGLKRAARLFKGKEYVLVKGDGCGLSAQKLLHWPERFNTQAKRLNELADEWNRIGGYGFAWSKADTVRDGRAEEIDDEWLKLMAEILPQEYGKFTQKH